MHINHRKGETRAKAQNYRYSDASRIQACQDASNTERRREDRRKIIEFLVDMNLNVSTMG